MKPLGSLGDAFFEVFRVRLRDCSSSLYWSL